MKTKTIVRDKAVSRSVLSASMVILALTLFGCLVAAVPMIINATKGSSTSTATVLINRDAATVYADAVKVIKQRGYTKITKQDNANYFLEGVRKGKNATLKVAAVGSNQSRVIITIENDKEAKDINEAVQALMQTCRQLGVQCREQKG
jgi:ribosomal protein L11